MILIGVVLLIVGVVLLLAPLPFPNVDAIGWLLLVVGVILVAVALVSGSDAIDHARSSWGQLA